MKKFKFLIGALVLAVSLCAVGCSSDDKPKDGEKTDNPPITQTEPEKNGEKAVYVKASSLPDMTNWSEVNHYTGDIDGDGTDENIVLMTSAQRGSDGELLWDDGQNWTLYVDDRSEKYVLLNEYVQLGKVHFEVVDYYMKDGAEPRVNLFVSTGAGLKIKSFAFDKEESGYREEIIYDTSAVTEGGINRRYSSFEAGSIEE